MMTYYSFDVWRRTEGPTLTRYRCLKILENGKFFVKSADFYRLPLSAQQLEEHERSFIEFLLEDSISGAVKTFDSVEEAISNHDKEFGNPF